MLHLLRYVSSHSPLFASAPASNRRCSRSAECCKVSRFEGLDPLTVLMPPLSFRTAASVARTSSVSRPPRSVPLSPIADILPSPKAARVRCAAERATAPPQRRVVGGSTTFQDLLYCRPMSVGAVSYMCSVHAPREYGHSPSRLDYDAPMFEFVTHVRPSAQIEKVAAATHRPISAL